jgi:membrane protein DedA with SNARE-associated domain
VEAFISEWGYLAVFLGSLIEGESVILTAGFLASQGYLSLYKIILVSFVGTVIADQTLFFLGHWCGDWILDRFPSTQKPAKRAFQLLHKYNTFYILTFRFIYGIRIISPVIIGAARISFLRFAILNIIAAAIWAILSCCAGYAFGEMLMTHFTHFQRFFILGSVGFLFLGTMIWKVWVLLFKEESLESLQGRPPPPPEETL